MSRKEVLTYADLLEKVQGLLAFYPQECRNIQINGLQVYREQVDGANWHIGMFQRSGDENDLVECRESIVAELRTLRVAYDVDPDSK
jgi:hypothetical protein